MKSMCVVTLLVLFSQGLAANENSMFDIVVTSSEKLSIGHVSAVRFEVKNISDQSLAILEFRPAQPCEEPISLVRSLYGKIDYDQQTDTYIYDSKAQMTTMIPVVEGFLPPGKTVWLDTKFRPFDRTEDIIISYALVGDQKIYFRARGEDEMVRFTPKASDSGQVILSRLTELDRKEETVKLIFPEITGDVSKLCYCETLRAYVDYLPHSLCKEWDSGKTVKFRVGEKQEGIGPDARLAGWKFLDVYPVYYGDGVYTHGEFIDISPELAEGFAAKLQKRYSINRISYFFTEHYYDLEPTL